MRESTVPVKQEETQAPAQDTREESRVLRPPVDIFEMNEGLAVIVDLPGVEKQDVDISVDNNVLTIRGKVRTSEQGEPVYSEFQLRDFYRQFELGETIDQEKIRADVKHGVLTVHLPKAERAKPRRINIDVQS